MIFRAFSTISITESYGRVRVHVSGKADRAEQVLIFETRGKETQLYNTTTVCLGLGGRKKHTHTTDKLFLRVQTSIGGAAAPLASTPPSAESDPASDGDTVEGSPPQRKMSAPRLSHCRQGLLQEPGPSRRLDRPLRSLSQLSPEDTSPAHGLGSPIPGLVPPVDDLARFQPPPLHLLGLGSHLLLADEVFFSSRLRLCPC
jgi:hypothetical protein